ncbi:Gfo/Idh/MocA family oxidoreductase [Streptomyces sp. NPDC047315]|uniref:Gfo/Idh/MocA family protein n=1 Tax=Streptomyces sp. NPDC047315 TaxID=3155142 RepID=UPI0033F675FC
MRVGLVGAGPWAERTHAPALGGHDGVAFAGVWARREEAAQALGGRYGVPALTGEDGIDALFAVCDAVAFAVPPDVQAPLVGRAARAGCHVLLDKPVATDPTAAREAADAVARAGVASLVFCTMRFARASRDWLAEQAAKGGWFTGRTHWYGSLFAADSDSPYAASPWRREKGGLWDLGPHALAALVPVLGDVTEVTAARGPADTVHLVLRHAGGASSTVTLTLSAPARAQGVGLEFVGEEGAVSLTETWDAVASFGSAVDALVESARTGRAHDCDIRFGLRLTEVLAAAEAQLG